MIGTYADAVREIDSALLFTRPGWDAAGRQRHVTLIMHSASLTGVLDDVISGCQVSHMLGDWTVTTTPDLRARTLRLMRFLDGGKR